MMIMMDVMTSRDGKSVRNSTDANFRPKKLHKKRVIRNILQLAVKQRKFPRKELRCKVFISIYHIQYIMKVVVDISYHIHAYNFLTQAMQITRRMAERALAV